MENWKAAVAAFKEWDGEGDAPGPWVRTTYGTEPGVKFRRMERE